eukprot:4809651-Prymnesium_polylepis.1
MLSAHGCSTGGARHALGRGGGAGGRRTVADGRKAVEPAALAVAQHDAISTRHRHGRGGQQHHLLATETQGHRDAATP